MNLNGLFILDVNIKYIVFSNLYRHINVPMACKELRISKREDRKLNANFWILFFCKTEFRICAINFFEIRKY